MMHKGAVQLQPGQIQCPSQALLIFSVTCGGFLDTIHSWNDEKSQILIKLCRGFVGRGNMSWLKQQATGLLRIPSRTKQKGSLIFIS